MEETQRTAVKSADRVIDLFELLGQWGQGLSHTAIAEELEIPKSSLTQLLKNLTERGYVEFVPEGRSYRLGARFGVLARTTAQIRDLPTLALPMLERITEQTQESSALNVLKGDQAEVVNTVISTQRLVWHMRLGDLAPLYATSGGKVVLACLPDKMRDEYLGRVKLDRYTSHTITSLTELRKQLNAARRDRVAYSFEEFTEGIIGIAVPILSPQDYPLGSLNVAMPAVRYSDKTRDAVIESLQRAAQSLEKLLHGPAAPVAEAVQKASSSGGKRALGKRSV